MSETTQQPLRHCPDSRSSGQGVAAHDVTRIRGQQSEPAPVWTALESSVLISLVGMLDAVSGDELQRQVESLGAIGITNIFLDLSGVCAMDAGGVTQLGTALRGAEDRGGSLALLDSSTVVRETLSSHDFTSFRPVGGMLR